MKPGEGMYVGMDDPIKPELHEIIHLVADIHKALEKIEKIIDKAVREK